MGFHRKGAGLPNTAGATFVSEFNSSDLHLCMICSDHQIVLPESLRTFDVLSRMCSAGTLHKILLSRRGDACTKINRLQQQQTNKQTNKTKSKH